MLKALAKSGEIILNELSITKAKIIKANTAGTAFFIFTSSTFSKVLSEMSILNPLFSFSFVLLK